MQKFTLCISLLFAKDAGKVVTELVFNNFGILQKVDEDNNLKEDSYSNHNVKTFGNMFVLFITTQSKDDPKKIRGNIVDILKKSNISNFGCCVVTSDGSCAYRNGNMEREKKESDHPYR